MSRDFAWSGIVHGKYSKSIIESKYRSLKICIVRDQRRLSFLLNLSCRSWILSLTPSIRILFSLVSNLWLITLSYFINYWYWRLFLSRTSTSFLFKLFCFPLQLFIPRVDSRCPFSLLSAPPNECPYRDLNISFLGERISLRGLIEWFLTLWTVGFLKWFCLALLFGSSTWTILALWRSKFWLKMRYFNRLYN